MPLLAGIDVGTNTVRLLVAEVRIRGEALELTEVYTDRAVTRLGEGVAATRRLKPAAMDRTLAVLRRFGDAILRLKPEGVSAVGTSVLRLAADREVFLARVRETCPFEIEVITGEEEARCTYRGVRSLLRPLPEKILVVDIGGGSTELIAGTGPVPETLISVETGVVRLTERFLISDPPSPAEIADVRAEIRRHLAPMLRSIEAPGPVLVATAGTATTLAAIDLGLTRYDPMKVQGHRIPRSRLDNLAQWLAGMSLAQRRAIPAVEPGREDVIVAGALTLQAVAESSGAPDVVVSEYGLREGILLRWMDRHGPPT